MAEDGDDDHPGRGGGRAEATPPPIVRVLPAGTMAAVAPDEHLEAAASAGFDLISWRPRELRRWTSEGSGRSLDELVARLDHLGMGVAELDPVVGWSDPRAWPTQGIPRPVLEDLDLAAAAGALAVTALVAPGEPWEPGPGVSGLAALCAAAGERGVAVQVEPFGWSALHGLAEAAAAVAEVGGPGVGLMVDTWHLERGGGGLDALEQVPVDVVLGLQVADGPRPTGADRAEENRTGRCWPGDPAGRLHPERVLSRLLDRGWRGPVAVEVFGAAPPPQEDPAARAARAARSMDAMLARTGR